MNACILHDPRLAQRLGPLPPSRAAVIETAALEAFGINDAAQHHPHLNSVQASEYAAGAAWLAYQTPDRPTLVEILHHFRPIDLPDPLVNNLHLRYVVEHDRLEASFNDVPGSIHPDRSQLRMWYMPTTLLGLEVRLVLDLLDFVDPLAA